MDLLYIDVRNSTYRNVTLIQYIPLPVIPTEVPVDCLHMN